MMTPTFNAEGSIFRSTRQYVTTAYYGYRDRQYISPQQEPAECCDAHCSGACWCSGGIGHCIPFSEESYAARVSKGGFATRADVCESGDGLMGCACSCGCVAGPHSCDCLPCHVPE